MTRLSKEELNERFMFFTGFGGILIFLSLIGALLPYNYLRIDIRDINLNIVKSKTDCMDCILRKSGLPEVYSIGGTGMCRSGDLVRYDNQLSHSVDPSTDLPLDYDTKNDKCVNTGGFFKTGLKEMLNRDLIDGLTLDVSPEFNVVDKSVEKTTSKISSISNNLLYVVSAAVYIYIFGLIIVSACGYLSILMVPVTLAHLVASIYAIGLDIAVRFDLKHCIEAVNNIPDLNMNARSYTQLGTHIWIFFICISCFFVLVGDFYYLAELYVSGDMGKFLEKSKPLTGRVTEAFGAIRNRITRVRAAKGHVSFQKVNTDDSPSYDDSIDLESMAPTLVDGENEDDEDELHSNK